MDLILYIHEVRDGFTTVSTTNLPESIREHLPTREIEVRPIMSDHGTKAVVRLSETLAASKNLAVINTYSTADKAVPVLAPNPESIEQDIVLDDMLTENNDSLEKPEPEPEPEPESNEVVKLTPEEYNLYQQGFTSRALSMAMVRIANERLAATKAKEVPTGFSPNAGLV